MLNLKNYVALVPDYPKKGILFRDIAPLLASPAAFRNAIRQLAEEWQGRIDHIAALDARGFLFGGALGMEMHRPVTMVRKQGKLPGTTISRAYELEYGKNVIEVQEGAFRKNESILVLDDLLATGGTARAACNLIEDMGAIVAGCAFVIELSGLGGRDALGGYRVQSLVKY